jgi:glycine betaine/proline transport system substrate-binding protein
LAPALHHAVAQRPAVNCNKRPIARLRTAAATVLCLLLLQALAIARCAPPPDPASCKTVRFSDVGWTDVTATTAITAQLLRSIGYSATITVLSVPVTFASIKNNDIDVFLGNWMPAQEADRSRYVEEGSVVVVGPNLTGAKYTLAVPAYTYAAGLHDFKDIKEFAPQLNDSIYGIEPGNDGNRLVLKMLKENMFGLKRIQIDRIERAGHVGAGRACLPRPSAGGVPGMGAASHESALRPEVFERRR